MNRPYHRTAGSVALFVALVVIVGGSPVWATLWPPQQPGQFLDLVDGRLWYESVGDGPPLVFVHDGLADAAAWDAQVADLARDHRVVRYDRRGYGRSDPPEAPYSNLADLHALVEHMGIEAGVFVGSSSGGGLVLDYALEHPERVTALVLVGPVVRGFGYSSHFNARGMRNYDPDGGTNLENWLADTWSIAQGNDAARAHLRDILTASPHNLDQRKHQLHQAPAWAALPRLALGCATWSSRSRWDAARQENIMPQNWILSYARRSASTGSIFVALRAEG